jgi:ATP-dependent Clp protease ATP-binding subunit ClpB
LTDGHGRTVDFKNTVIIMTSNVGSHLIKEMNERNAGDIRQAVLVELDRTFRPEFLNRIDEVILFHSLTRDHLRQIVGIQLRGLAELLRERGISLELSDAARDYLADAGFDPVYGARPLKRAIQRELQDPLALAILEGRVQEGESVYVDVAPEGDRLVFSAAEYIPA